MLYRNIIFVAIQRLGHARVEDVFHSLKPEYPAISITTVYRNMKTLERKGEIMAFPHPDGSLRYEAHREDFHQHLICEACGAIVEVKFGFVEELAQSLKERAKFRIYSHKLSMPGRCVGCEMNNESSS